eukprot:GHVR01095889.1.p1 GENE.GHVR01095889.1~~GHVR01095889.1.p1  ORF type:complete len:131 (+),score=5.84 GHVR01095889.1:705-1097(+)
MYSDPDNMLDGNPLTSWTSAEFEEEHPLIGKVTIDLGGVYPIKQVVTSWTKPAVAYEIHLSVDGENYMKGFESRSNSQLSTTDPMGYYKAQFVRLVLMDANPELSKLPTGKLAYGIRNVSVLSNRLRTSE